MATFNRGRAGAQIVLKVSLHRGPCIAITLGGTLDYFGSAVNTAARLETQCRGGELVVSKAILADAEAREVVAGRRLSADQAILRGLREPVHFVRIAHAIQHKVTEGFGRGRNDCFNRIATMGPNRSSPHDCWYQRAIA